MATTQQLKTVNGEVVEIELGSAADINSFFVFCLHKSGSTLLNKMLLEICALTGVPVFQPEDLEFRNGFTIGSWDPGIQSLFVKDGFCYTSFRSYPPYLDDFDMSVFKKILLVRDPRDMVVSHYFSHKTSHKIPKGNLGEKMQAWREKVATMTIDDYAIWASKNAQRQFQRYISHIFDENLKVFRYEDVIFEKRQWLEDLLDFVQIDIGKQEIYRIADKHDIRPDEEDASRHIRRVTPGDHKEKLKQETIVELNDIFSEELDRFGYAA